jgi:hypothetical protein
MIHLGLHPHIVAVDLAVGDTPQTRHAVTAQLFLVT